jgi:hypothetical protein
LPGFGRPPSGHDLRKSRCRRAGDRLVGYVRSSGGAHDRRRRRRA